MKEIVCNDPIGKTLFLVSVENIKIILRKYRGSLMKFLTAETIGVISTIKPGQEQFKPALLLEKKYTNKKFYYFIDNDISFHQLENFPFIQVWVNTACPRVGFDDQEKFARGVINLNDALMAEKILSQESVLNKLYTKWRKFLDRFTPFVYRGLWKKEFLAKLMSKKSNRSQKFRYFTSS